MVQSPQHSFVYVRERAHIRSRARVNLVLIMYFLTKFSAPCQKLYHWSTRLYLSLTAWCMQASLLCGLSSLDI